MVFIYPLTSRVIRVNNDRHIQIDFRVKQVITIGVARDQAFSFIYPVNIDLLHTLGAEINYFSPLNDSSLPKVDALYLPGGYPELHLKQLSANTDMLMAISDFHKADKPMLAECGGMLYLLESMTDIQGHCENMAAVLKGQAHMESRLSNLGMHQIELPEGLLRGHTYHYSNVQIPLNSLSISVGARAGRPGEPVYRQGRLTTSYLHLYFVSNPEAIAQLFLPSDWK